MEMLLAASVFALLSSLCYRLSAPAAPPWLDRAGIMFLFLIASCALAEALAMLRA
jgi:hypothetical protein